MALEDLTGPSKYISNLVPTNPVATDPESQGQNHLNGIKNVLLNTFPNINGPVNATDEQLNALITPQVPQVPVGTVLDFCGTVAPTNFIVLPAAPSNISRTTYAALFAAIGTAWGAGDGSTTFGCPYLPANEAALAGTVPGAATIGQVLAHTHGMYGTTAYAEGGGGQPIQSGIIQTFSQTPAGAAKNYAAGVTFLKILRVQ
jgi:microcystin-dependent protein